MNSNDEVEGDVSREDNYRELIIYIISRVFLVFSFKLLIGALRNNKSKIDIFFKSYSDSIWQELFGWFNILLAILITIIFINFIFTLLRLAESKGKLTHYFKEYSIWKSIKYFFNNFFILLKSNYRHEWDRDNETNFYFKNPKQNTLLYQYDNKILRGEINGKICQTVRRCNLSHIFLVIAIFSVLFKGNSFLSNYYGLYNNYISGITREGDEIISEEHLYMIEKKDWNPTVLQNDVDKRGYVFSEAGNFDGFRNSYVNKGDLNYFICFLFFFIEKIIITFFYFLIPFLLSISFFYIKSTKLKYLFIIIILSIAPILFHFNYLGSSLQTSTSTTLILIIISIVNILPSMIPVFYKDIILMKEDKLLKIINWITISIISSYVVIDIYNKFFGRWLLLIPLVIWWGIVALLRSELKKEV